MRWTPAHALKLRRPDGTQCLRRGVTLLMV